MNRVGIGAFAPSLQGSRARWISLFLLAFAVACGPDTVDTGSHDSGSDAGSDAGTDAGSDAGSDGGTDAGTTDVTAPAAVNDLSATPKANGTTVTIAFTAVGDDGHTGTAHAYALRTQKLTNPAATCSFSAANFTGTVLALSGTPKAAGGAESFDVTVPASDNHYCFGLKVSDEAGNSSVSNIATATTPDVTAPAAVSNLTATPKAGGTTVTIAFTAVGDDGTTGTANAYELRYQKLTNPTVACSRQMAPTTRRSPTSRRRLARRSSRR